jgi:pyruvate/2-oxoglutarate dehydrogenase complex dihydrolipoamide dehydrogenase (E3) component
MTEVLTPDICVIGAGSGGLSVAAAAAAFGVPVVLIEKGKMGGECLNTGCVPSKSLIAAAKHVRATAAADGFGVHVAGTDIDFAGVHKHVHDVIATIAPTDSKERFTGLGVRVIEGTARFKDPDTVAVGDEIEVKARRFVVATGSSPSLPPIPGLDVTPHLTNETVFDLTVRPSHLLIIGAGPIGLELAQAFRRLGSKVTVLEAAEPLAREDRECAEIVLDQLAREGVELRSGVAVVRVAAGAPAAADVPNVQVVVRADEREETIEGSHLLVAAGRRVNTADLDLERAGIKFDGGGIRVDKRLKTANKRVYAIGDVAGRAQFTHVANYHAGLVVRNALFRLPTRLNEDAIPRVTFTDPELAHVGLTETEAKRRRSIRVLRWPYHENDRAQAERDTIGHIKVITSKRGKILGATIVGAAAGELITTWTLAISQGLNIRTLAGIVMPYPTLAEIGKRAAITYFTPSLASNWVRRIITCLRRFG